MSKPKKLALRDAYKMSGCIHELKVDGTSATWNGTQIISSRDIDRTNRFGQIVTDLQKLDAEVIGEIALPGGNVHEVTASVGWPKANMYIYNVLTHKGKDVSGYDASQKRRIIDELLRPRFDHLRSPMFFNSFKKGWDFVCKTRENGRYAEGIVLKNAMGREFKVKYMVEEKLEITGHEAGSLKGAFLLDRKGIVNKVSAASVGLVQDWKKLVAAALTPFAEIDYLFLTKEGKMFQPIIRRIGTWDDLQVS